MAVQIRNIELSFEDIVTVLKQCSSEERQRLFEQSFLFKNKIKEQHLKIQRDVEFEDKKGNIMPFFEENKEISTEIKSSTLTLNGFKKGDIPKTLDLEQLKLAQNYKGVNWTKVDAIAARFTIDYEPFNELLTTLD